MGSSTYWAWLFPSTLIRWLGGAICPARVSRQKMRHCAVKQAEAQGSEIFHQGKPLHLALDIYQSTYAPPSIPSQGPHCQTPKATQAFSSWTPEHGLPEIPDCLSSNVNRTAAQSQLWAEVFKQITPCGFSHQLKAFLFLPLVCTQSKSLQVSVPTIFPITC